MKKKIRAIKQKYLTVIDQGFLVLFLPFFVVAMIWFFIGGEDVFFSRMIMGIGILGPIGLILRGVKKGFAACLALFSSFNAAALMCSLDMTKEWHAQIPIENFGYVSLGLSLCCGFYYVAQYVKNL